MQESYRAYIYAFLSRFFSDNLDRRFLEDLKQNSSLLETVGEDSAFWLESTPLDEVLELCNIDYSSMYLLNTQPVESFVLDAKSESLVGLQNPVMAFYFQHGFDVKMNQTNIMAPDHLSIELAFMQTLSFRGEENSVEIAFLQEHLIPWVIPYMQGMRSMATTALYRDMCDFVIEFLLSDYEHLLMQRAS